MSFSTPSLAARTNYITSGLKGDKQHFPYILLFDTLVDSRKKICDTDPQNYFNATGWKLDLSDEYVCSL